ncbi:Rdx family-domain-containing protein [Amylocystis lapponica]|nr:Rdx family-domain-containing protein [Amylocystis lapponica]
MADPGSCVDCINPEAVSPSAQPPHDPLDASTFVPPSPLPIPSVTIEFCDRCRWLHRATWVSTELFLTFPAPLLKAISILPLNSEETGGRFRVWLFLEGQPPILVWDRKIEGGFPELKVLKQRIRDRVQPGKSLGHSDHK